MSDYDGECPPGEDPVRWTKYGEMYREKMKQLAESMQPTFEAMARRMCADVVKDPALAGTGIDLGDWERGDFGACRMVYPSLEEAEKYLAGLEEAGP